MSWEEFKKYLREENLKKQKDLKYGKPSRKKMG